MFNSQHVYVRGIHRSSDHYLTDGLSQCRNAPSPIMPRNSLGALGFLASFNSAATPEHPTRVVFGALWVFTNRAPHSFVLTPRAKKPFLVTSLPRSLSLLPFSFFFLLYFLLCFFLCFPPRSLGLSPNDAMDLERLSTSVRHCPSPGPRGRQKWGRTIDLTVINRTL